MNILQHNWLFESVVAYLSYRESTIFISISSGDLSVQPQEINQAIHKCYVRYGIYADRIRRLFYQRILYTRPNRSWPSRELKQKDYRPISMSSLQNKIWQSPPRKKFTVLVKESPDPLQSGENTSRHSLNYFLIVDQNSITEFQESVEDMKGYHMVFLWEFQPSTPSGRDGLAPPESEETIGTSSHSET